MTPLLFFSSLSDPSPDRFKVEPKWFLDFLIIRGFPMKQIAVCIGVILSWLVVSGCETTKKGTCYRHDCDNRPLYWHELGDYD